MKSVKQLLRKYLNEMAMDFDSEDRPASDVERRLQTGNLELNQVPFPKTGNEPQQNFLELISSARYKAVVQKLRQATGYNRPLNRDSAIGQLAQILMGAVRSLEQKERQHIKELEKLAVETALNLFGLSEDEVKIDAKIDLMGNVEKVERIGETNKNLPTVKIEEKLADELSQFNLAAASRRLKNSLIQGAGNIVQLDSQYLKNAIEQRLGQITGDPNIYNTYITMMATNDTLYWQMPDAMVLGHADTPAGSENVNDDDNDGVWEVKARGINFIVLLHECIKGLMEYLSLHERGEEYQEVFNQVNTLANETWDLRLGPEIYDRFRNFFTDIIFEFDDVNINKMQTYFWKTIFNLPDRKFLILSVEILNKSNIGKEILRNLFNGLYGHFIDDEEMYQEYTQKYIDLLDELSNDEDAPTDEELNQSLDDLLGDIGGIGRAN
jgi:hypothetical protein